MPWRRRARARAANPITQPAAASAQVSARMISYMRDSSDATTQLNYYDQLFARVTGDGLSIAAAVERVAGVYLDGKPQTLGGRKLTRKERDNLFWSSLTVKDCLPEAWATETMVI